MYKSLENPVDTTRRLRLGNALGIFGLRRLVVVLVAEGANWRGNKKVRAEECPCALFCPPLFGFGHDAPSRFAGPASGSRATMWLTILNVKGSSTSDLTILVAARTVRQ
jgi:hypothetical protein